MRTTVSQIFDIDQDGKDELILSTSAPFNVHYEIPYPDSISWLMVLDEDLNFLFEPVALKEKFSAIHAYTGLKVYNAYTLQTVNKYRDYSIALAQYNLDSRQLLNCPVDIQFRGISFKSASWVKNDLNKNRPSTI
ncbi:MAG: hypothetical protein AAF519_14110 [Bacteroidota bacterium]